MGGRNLEAGAGPMGAKLNAGAEPPGPIKFPEIILLVIFSVTLKPNV